MKNRPTAQNVILTLRCLWCQNEYTTLVKIRRQYKRQPSRKLKTRRPFLHIVTKHHKYGLQHNQKQTTLVKNILDVLDVTQACIVGF